MRPDRSIPIASALVTLALIVAAAPRCAEGGPTLAAEDTIALASGALPEVLVTAPRVTLDEILRRVAEGEARRDGLIHDQSFTATVRVVRDVVKSQPRLLSETVTRVYRKKPDLVREVPLRRSPEKKNVNVEISFTPSTAERIVSYAFAPELRRQFRFRILGRDLVAAHVIYRVGYEPRSPLAALASRGQVWIDTNDFIIVRQDAAFARSPAPLIFKSVDRMVVERAPAGAGHWAISRIMMRAQTTLPVPKLGSSFDLAVLLDDYQVNAGLADAFFDAPGGRRVPPGRRGEDR